MAMVSNHICLAVISLDSAQKKDENYYLQVFLKECKYTRKMIRCILLIIWKVLLMILMKSRL